MSIIVQLQCVQDLLALQQVTIRTLVESTGLDKETVVAQLEASVRFQEHLSNVST
jgi:hypothetical protein